MNLLKLVRVLYNCFILVENNYYLIGDLLIEPGDYVMLHSEEPNEPLLIAYVCYLWKELTGEAMFHAYLFCRGSNTVLGETSDPRELFLVDICDNCPLGSIVRKAKVSTY